MWYDVDGLRSGALGAANAAEQAALAQNKLTGMGCAKPSAFGDVDDAGGIAGAVQTAREQHSEAIAVFANNARTAAQRAALAADLGAELATVTERAAVVGSGAAQAQVLQGM